MRIDTWGRAFKYWWRRDPGEIRYVLKHLKPGDFAIDVGGYKGGYTYWMRYRAGKTGRVVTFEPQPALSERLKKLVAAFGWDNVKIEQMGLSSADGKLTLSLPKGRPVSLATLEPREGEEYEKYDVPVETLDHYLERRKLTGVKMIKVDAEGHEVDVFRGAEACLKRDRPRLLFECEEKHRKNLTTDTFEFLKSMNYRGYFFWGKVLRPIEDFRLAVHQVPGQRPSGSNFAFEPK